MNSNKRKIDESDTDDCDSKRIKREDSDCSVDGFYYTRSRAANIAQLPNEILLSIFSYLGPPELYWNVRLVCVNWYKLSMCPSLWTKIKIGPELEVSTKRLLIWLTIAGNKLKRLEMNNRMDASTVIRKVCRANRHVEVVHITNCYGNNKQMVIPSVPLCNLLSQCRRITEICLAGSKFKSCKFFRILAMINMNRLNNKQKRGKFKPLPPRAVRFTGNASRKQMHTFLTTRRDISEGNNNVELFIDDGGHQNASLLANRQQLNGNDIDEILDIVYQ